MYGKAAASTLKMNAKAILSLLTDKTRATQSQ